MAEPLVRLDGPANTLSLADSFLFCLFTDEQEVVRRPARRV